MKIKNVRKTIKKNKKTVASVAILGLTLILTSCETKQDRIDALESENRDLLLEITEVKMDKINLELEKQKIQKEYDELYNQIHATSKKDCYYKNDLMAVVTNDKDGTPEYRFVEDNYIDADWNVAENLDIAESAYVSITNPEIYYPNLSYRHDLANGNGSCTYNTVKKFTTLIGSTLYGGWIPDSNIEHYLISDINNLPIPTEYQDKTSFSVEELREIEDEMNNHLLDATEQVEQQTFSKYYLYFVLTEENTGFFVKSNNYFQTNEMSDPYDLYSLEYQYYYHSITNPMHGLKRSIPFSDNDKYNLENKSSKYEVVSLDPNDEMLCSVQDVLPISNIIGWDAYEKYQEKETLTYEEILELEQTINKVLAETNVKTLKK